MSRNLHRLFFCFINSFQEFLNKVGYLKLIYSDSVLIKPKYSCVLKDSQLILIVCKKWNSLISLFYDILLQQWHPTPVLLHGKSHGQRNLVGCSPWGREESDTTERLPFHFSLSCIGEGNGNPLQCSCLENPRDGGAWWAAQSQTRLKWLSSSSSSVRLEPLFLSCI